MSGALNDTAAITNQILGGSLSNTITSGAQTGGVTTAQNGSIYEISAAQGGNITSIDSTAALNQQTNDISLEMQALQNVAGQSELNSSSLATAAGQALKNRSQSTAQAIGQDIVFVAALAAAAWAVYQIFRG